MSLNLNNIYWIGGSPCAGKSTISELLVKECGFIYYKCDDYAERHLEIGARRNYPIMSKIAKMTSDEIWLCPVREQVSREIVYYEENLQLIYEDLEKLPADKKILVEGTPLLPKFIEEQNISQNRALFIIPTPEFQLKHYVKREYIPYILSNCTDKEQAFNNWMQRDIEFAKEIAKQASHYNRPLIMNDGSRTIEKIVSIVKELFELTI